MQPISTPRYPPAHRGNVAALPIADAASAAVMGAEDATELWPVDWQNDDYWNEAQTTRYVKMHRTQLFRMEADGLFPKRIHISTRRVVWRSASIKSWMDAAALRHEQAA